jgi:hypothetical protein
MFLKHNIVSVLIPLIFQGSIIFGQSVDTTSFSIIPRLSYFSYETEGEILIHIPPHLTNDNMVITLGTKELTISDWSGIPRNKILRLKIGLNQLTSSEKIHAEIINRSTNQKYAAKCSLVILPYKKNEVKTDRLTGGLIVNRRQFFPFGFYCYSPVYSTLPEEEVVRGFNMISPYQRIVPETLHERKKYMDRCAQLGMKVHYNLLSASGGGGVGSKIEGYSNEEKRELLIKEIKTFMDHPALLAWYISDEPTGNKVEPETLEEIYKVVKETDPWHPVSIVFMAPFLSAKKYENAVDIVMADPYPIPDLPASMVGEVTGKLEKEFHGEKPVWIVPQAFGGGELWGREPSIQEIRSMTYQSLINGATGIQYFLRNGLNSFPKSVPTWNECGRMAVEIAELTPWLLSDEEPNSVVSTSEKIAVSSKLHNNQLVVLAVNKVNEPLRAEIGISGIGNSRAKVIFENRTVSVNSGFMSDMLPAFGSQAYLIELNKREEKFVPWSGNMIKDSGFEDITSTGIPAACYARTNGDRGATYFLDTREHIEGDHSLRIITPSDSNSVTIRFFPVNLTSGKSYLLSIWAKSDPEQRPIIISSLDETGNGKKSRLPQYVEISLGEFGKARFEPLDRWQQFVTIVTIPNDSISKVKANVILKMPGQGVAWFDMLQLIEDPVKR